MMMRSLVFAALTVASVRAAMGFDGIQAISTATFTCLRNNGYSFFIARVWESIGNYDYTGMQNIRNAHAAGLIRPGPVRKNLDYGSFQIEATINKLKATGTVIGTLWLDIETQDWPANHATNRQFILDMANQAKAMGVTVGVYTNPHNWGTIVGNDFTGCSHLPLWWANWSGQQNWNNWSNFGGWTKAAMRQYTGGHNGPCGVNMDANWYP